MTNPSPACPTATRLYRNGAVVATDFPYSDVPKLLAEHPDAVLWLDLLRPEKGDLEALAAEFHLHPLAVEDAESEHERPKLDRYAEHLFLNVYAVDIGGDKDRPRPEKIEISAFITKQALITVRKAPFDTARLVESWDRDARIDPGAGVAFLLYGLLDYVVDGQYAAAQKLDEAMDGVEDAMLEEGGAPRSVRIHGLMLQKVLAALRRAVAPMPEVVATAMRNDLDLVGDRLQPYFRDVEDHAQHTVDQVEHLRDQISGLLQADLAEQGNVLNIVTRKLAAWAAIIAVPTAITGYFGQNLPYWGYEKFWGFLLSLAMIAFTGGGLYVYLKRRGWM